MQKPRLSLDTLAPQPFRHFVDADQLLRRGRLDETLQELVRLRVSQINGCTFCVDMHGHDLRNAGETFARLNLLAAWHEAPCFDAREKAALHFAEVLTASKSHAAVKDACEKLQGHFEPGEIAELLLVVASINALNRIAIGTGIPVPARTSKAA